MTSQMEKEALESPQAIALQLRTQAGPVAALAERLIKDPPRAIVTVARGSSDHAASYFAYLTMQRMGALVTSLPMSLLTLYDAPLQFEGALALAVSQSGQSPDIVETMRAARMRGARCVALVNAPRSPLAAECDQELPLCAGVETSVAATKSCLASLAMGAALVAAWQKDNPLRVALERLPDCLARISGGAGAALVETLAGAQHVLVAGRATGLAIAQEAALKLKETCAIQAEAFSSAEIRHGPMALIRQGYPLLIFATRGPAFAGLLGLAADMSAKGARILLIAPEGTPGASLPYPPAADPCLDPLPALLAFYLCAARIAGARGLNPDVPRHLNKVTLTR